MKVLSVVGNRPQFVKAAPMSLALRAAGIEDVVVHTGAHYDRELSQLFFEELELREPAFRLAVGGRPRAEMLELVEAGVAPIVELERPDWLLVYGDTNSTLGAARAALATGTPLAHVEAGLRSGDLAMPEEQNRIAADRLAQLLLCPTERARATLAAEGVEGRVEVVGDVMADVSRRLAPLARERSSILARFALEPGGYLVATLHREANVEPSRLGRIIEGLNRVGERVIFPAHPRTRAALAANGLALGRHVRVEPPLGYLDLAALASQARVIVTDSGGLQKEAYWYGVPCVTTRPTTEWPETVEAGANVLVDDDPERLLHAVEGARMPVERPELYGDGNAAERIVRALR